MRSKILRDGGKWDKISAANHAEGKGGVPKQFRPLLLYIGSNTLSSLPWAIPFGEKEINTMQKQARDIMDWYDGLRRVIPKWYAQQ